MTRQITIALTTAASPVVLLASAQGEYSVTDLVDAAKRGDGHAVHRLVESGTDLGATGPMGYTALHWAGVRGHWLIFEELVAAGAPANAVGADGGTPLHWTCHHDRADMVLLLLDAGADPEVTNRWGRAPLHVTARRGCPQVATLLLERGVDPNGTTKEGWTPLHVAYLSGHPGLAELLLVGGADPSVTDADGLTPIAAARQRPVAIDVDPAGLEDFVGLYDLGHGFTVKVWKEAEVLSIREFAPDGLYPIGEDLFFCRQEPWQVRFVRADTGDVESIEIQFLRRTVHGTRIRAPRYVGSQTCLGCHTGPEEGRQDIAWMRSRHAHAYWRLGADWALFLAKLRPHYQDLERPIADQRCLLCHVSGAQDPDALFSDAYRIEEGVSCEACHGPGSQYIEPEIMADREAFIANGGRMPDEATCRTCHRNSDNFEWSEFWPKIEHPRPDAPETPGI